MHSKPLHTKVADQELRRFAEQRAGGERSVLIEMDLPSGVSNVGHRHTERIQPSKPYRVLPLDEGPIQTSLEVDQLKRWLEDIGLSVRYLRASHVFVTKVTSEQLMQIVTSDKVRSVAVNRRVRAF